MARIFITGSADGLGQLAANALVPQDYNARVLSVQSCRLSTSVKQC